MGSFIFNLMYFRLKQNLTQAEECFVLMSIKIRFRYEILLCFWCARYKKIGQPKIWLQWVFLVVGMMQVFY